MSEVLVFRDDHGQEDALRRALLNANQPEALELHADKLEPMPSAVEARLASLLRNPFRYAQKRTRPLWRRVLRVAACVTLVFAVVLGGAMAVSTQVRTWVINMVITWRQGGTQFHGTRVPLELSNVGVWSLNSVPDGFVEVNRVDAGESHMIDYEKDSWYRLTFIYQPVQAGYMFDMDNENSVYREMILNEQTAYLFDSDTEGKMSSLIWFSENSTMGFQLLGDFTGKELLEMAQTVVWEE